MWYLEAAPESAGAAPGPRIPERTAMINADALFTRYKELRRNGYDARCAARAVIRPVEAPAIDWMDGSASIEIGPYMVELKQDYDDDPDLSWLGEFSNTPGPDAIDRTKTRAGTRAHEFRYWNPAVTLDEHYRELHGAGFSKADAWLKALEYRERIYSRIESFCHGYWVMIGITATARIDDIVCGDASLWGIESDAGDHIDEIAHELAREAVAAAAANRDTMICDRAQEIATLATTTRGTV